ncbi:isocitrate lyase/PEP mutase family protein [Halomonas sp. EGI 63088]|uniref:Isocitrate lyase/PEP mutase family protein n=1 Tax=Halomonas flagellata TaxID=2920385 RepID=A0ABS9RVP3_9GAMM|nr:isocitrate lyase/PEP mutase family protein [Halomonas flagellata]MCH4563880.1 isocitrate lyase/PEP mutase family protein [Halomonas flagellata]
MSLNIRELLSGHEVIAAPGVYDLISLRIAAQCGAKILYMTGYGTVGSHLGVPDAGIASYRDMLSRVQIMAPMAAEFGVPLIADGDTGYGGVINVAHTVRGYEAAGASAIQLEDQTFPKKCGHTLGRSVIPADEMATKIKVAVDSRKDDEFLVIARTDARTTLGLDEAIERMSLYAEAGADLLFLESPESVEELEIIGKSFNKPLVANMVEGGRTPLLDTASLGKLGFKLALFPAVGFLAAGYALEKAYKEVILNGNSPEKTELSSFEKFNSLMGFEDVWELEKKYQAK